MTVTLELPPDIEASLLERAQALGIDVSEYLQNLVRGQITGLDKPFIRPAYELPPEEWARQFQAWMASHDRNTVVLPDEAMEREAIYGDRGL